MTRFLCKYSTGLIPPKKSRGKGSQGKKTADTPEADVDVFEESESEPARKRTRVPDESTIIPATLSEGTGTKPGVLNEEKVDTDEEEEKNDDDDDGKSIDLEKTDDKETDNEFVHSEENVQNDDEFVQGNGDEEFFDAAKVDAEKSEEVKVDTKKAEFPPSSSSLS
nr:hypothetical protein [Tanacetum cinerariifolium]